jgi:hypothetical protein
MAIRPVEPPDPLHDVNRDSRASLEQARQPD